MDVVNTRYDAGSFAHVLRTFAISLLVSFVASLLGRIFYSDALVGICAIVEVVMILAAVLLRVFRKPIGYTFLYVFTAASGVVLGSAMQGYGTLIGSNLVTLALFITTGMFGSLAFYAYRSNRDFSFLRGFLYAATIGLLLLGVFSLFVTVGPFVNVLWAAGGIVVFSGWILFDVAQYRDGVDPRWVPMAALNLYLDFVNLFLYILQLIAALTRSSR